MGSIHTVLEAIIDNGDSSQTGKKVQLQVADKHEYETIRTRLVKLWVEHRNVIVAIGGEDDPLAQLSLCGDLDATTMLATFYLGKPRRRVAKSYSFAIVDSGATPPVSLIPANDELPTPITKAAE